MIGIDFLKQIALGYIINYRSFNISTKNTYTDITNRELDFFTKQGEYFGYRSIREDNRRDLVWKDLMTDKIVLYLERETKNDRVTDNAFQKLLSFSNNEKILGKGIVKLGLFGWLTNDKFENIKKDFEKLENSIFIIWLGPKIDQVDELRIMINYQNEIKKLCLQTDIDQNEYWHIFFNNKIKWE